jgi:hypothetical protein
MWHHTDSAYVLGLKRKTLGVTAAAGNPLLPSKRDENVTVRKTHALMMCPNIKAGNASVSEVENVFSARRPAIRRAMALIY